MTLAALMAQAIEMFVEDPLATDPDQHPERIGIAIGRFIAFAGL